MKKHLPTTELIVGPGLGSPLLVGVGAYTFGVDGLHTGTGIGCIDTLSTIIPIGTIMVTAIVDLIMEVIVEVIMEAEHL